MFVPAKEHIKNVVLYEFHKDVNASATVKSIHRAYGIDAFSERSCKRWFSFFKTENFSVESESVGVV